MRHIRNPFATVSGYNCFGCSPKNPIGLRMNFTEVGEEIRCRWAPSKDYQGYKDVLHGGIQATLMDEIASWVVFVKLKTGGVTASMEVRYHHPVYVTKGEIELRSRLISHRRNLAELQVDLMDQEGKICSTATLKYFTFSLEQSKKTMFYPAFEDFFEDGSEPG
ncbi:MAG: PaaI family thioesterase [Bacteroidetes bacterium]|nr:PaaI family thioesterase [Bacteroidota bacterium]